MDESPPDSNFNGVTSATAVVVLKRLIQLLIVVACLLLFSAVVTFVELDGWREMNVLGGWHNWLINTLNAGWFAFVLVRVVVLFLIVLAVCRLWRWSHFVGRSLAILVVLSLVTFIAITSYSPIGIYGVVDEIEGDGDHYDVFAGGKVEAVRKPKMYFFSEKVDVRENTYVQWAHYEKTADGLILTERGESGRKFKLESSWFGIWLINVEAPQSRIILGRRIIPFLRPDWMPNWLQ